MNQFVMVGLALLLAIRPAAVYASTDDLLWSKMLATTPIALRTAITDESKQLLQSSTTEALPMPPKARLSALLSHTRQKSLLPDAAFNQLAAVVLGVNSRPERAFVQSLTDYLLQPETACKQPMFARYFRQRYGESDASDACHQLVPFTLLAHHEGAKTVWLDPTRVKSIHLLFGGEGQGIASRFGHVALRLIVCPQGKSTTDDCDANLSEHLVLGFQAHINEFTLDHFKGLTGQYKAHLFANSFMDVYQQYAVSELREVYSLPLQLSDSQREAMVRELADIHWRYTGKYGFFGNNCATILQDALREIWPDFRAKISASGTYFRPDRFFNAMRTSSLTDGDQLTNKDSAEQKGFYFSSTRSFYDRAVQVVRAHRLHPDFESIESYLAIEPNRRRQAMIDDIAFMATLASDSYVREAQILLEEYAFLRGERLLRNETVRFLEKQDMLTHGDSLMTQLSREHARVFNDCLLIPIRQQLRPIQRLDGIPEAVNIPAASTPSSACSSSKDKALLREAIVTVVGQDSVRWQKLNTASIQHTESIEILSFIKQQAITANRRLISGESP